MNVFQVYVCVSFPFGFKGGMGDLVVLIPDHCLSVYFRNAQMAVTVMRDQRAKASIRFA